MRRFTWGAVIAVGSLLSASFARSDPAPPIDAPKIVADVVEKCNAAFATSFGPASSPGTGLMEFAVETCKEAADDALKPALTRAQLKPVYAVVNQEVTRIAIGDVCKQASGLDARCQLAERLGKALKQALSREATGDNANQSASFLTYTAAVSGDPAWFGARPDAVALNQLEAVTPTSEKAGLGALVGLFMTARAAEQIYNNSSLLEESNKLRARLQRWDAYHFGGGDVRTPLPWELMINGAIFASHNRDAISARGYDLDPPNWALTIAHPSIGVAPFTSSGTPSGVTGVVEWLGYSRWDYSGPNGGRANEWGLSLVSVYQPIVGSRDWSPGLLLRTPFKGINLVVSDPDVPGSDGDPVISFSVDLQKVFRLERQPAAR